MATDFPNAINSLNTTLTSIETVLDLPSINAEIDALQVQVGAPDLWDDQANAQKVTGRLSVLQSEVERVSGLRSRLEDLEILVELAQEEGDADSLAEADAELGRLQAAIESLEVPTRL